MALILSFLWPGAGQWYLGNRRSAVAYALPMLVVVVVIAVSVANGFESFTMSLLDPSVALTLLALVAVIGAWRLLAMLDAILPLDRGLGVRARAIAMTGVLAALAIGVHGVAGYYAWSFYNAGSRIFVGTGQPDQSPRPDATGWDQGFVSTPFEIPSFESRVTILLTGVDKNEERTHSLTDTLLVISIDPKAKTVALISVPRDVAEFNLWDGRTYDGKINSLMSYAERHPDQFPEGGLATITHALSHIIGIPIHYYAAIDLDGFQRLVDVADGLDVTVTRAITDSSYSWLDGTYGFYLSEGKHHFDGRTALAFVRSRKGVGDNDFVRAARQQELLLALRAKMTNVAMLPKMPALLDAAGDMIRTNFPNDRIEGMLRFARSLEDDDVARVVLQPPTYSVHPPTNSTGGSYILRLKLDEIAKLSVSLFGKDSRYWGLAQAN